MTPCANACGRAKTPRSLYCAACGPIEKRKRHNAANRARYARLRLDPAWMKANRIYQLRYYHAHKTVSREYARWNA